MNSLEVLEQILKLIASGKLPKELYDEYLSDTEIGFKNFQDLKAYFNLERLEQLEKENLDLMSEIQEVHKENLTIKEIKKELENEKSKCTARVLEIINLKNENAQLKEDVEKLKIADKNNANLVKTNVDLVNKNLELQKENKDLKTFVEAYANARDELLIKNEQLEKALDLACERLNWDCPVSQDLIADLDCENRCTDDFEECCKECWKLYFLKGVLE